MSDIAFDAIGDFKLTVQDPKTDKAALKIDAQYAAHFQGKKPIDRVLAERFVKSELKLVMWPFFRQFVFDTTGRMAIRPITVPLSTEIEEQ